MQMCFWALLLLVYIFTCVCLCVFVCMNVYTFIMYVYIQRNTALKMLLHKQTDDADVLLGLSAVGVYKYI